MGKIFNNIGLFTLLLFSIVGLTANAQETDFAPWNQTLWADYYDESGRVTKPFQINEDVVFETRATPWKLVLSPDFNGTSLFEVTGRGITVDGNGVEVDATSAIHSQPLATMYTAGRGPWDIIPTVSGILFTQPNQDGKAATVIKNFTVKGFHRGVRLGNPNSFAHAVIVENCILARNVIGLYTNGNNAIIQNNQIIENGFCGVYSGYRSYGNMFTKNTFRDNVLFQAQASYGEFVGDACYNTSIVDNIFAKSLINNNSLKHIGISIYRNEGEDYNLREDIPMNSLIQGNKFNSYSLAVHVASRMGRNPNYDITKEGRDYAFYNQIKNNEIIDCSVGIKINSEGNTIDGNIFTNTNYPIVLHPVFFKLKNTTINNQPNETVHIWYVKSDYSTVPDQDYLFNHQDNINGSILRSEKRVEVFSAIGTPDFTAVGGINTNEFKLNPTPPEDLLWDHRFGNPIVKKQGEFQANLPGNEIAAIWNEKISRVGNTDYHSILIFDQYGTEINRCGRSEIGWSQLAVGYFTRNSGEMEVAAVPKAAINGKYPVYIFRRGYADPQIILYPDNTNADINISSDTYHRLVVTFGNGQSPVLAWQFTQVPEGNNRGENPMGNTNGRETSIASSITNTGLQPSILKRGAGVGLASSLVRTFGGTFPNGGTETDALNNNRYYEFTVQPKTGFKTSLNTLDVKLRRNGENAPDKFKWMYSINEPGKPDADKVFTEIYAFTYSTITDETNGDAQSQINLSGFTALQDVDESKEITFRLYAWGAKANNISVAIGRFSSSTVASNAIALSVNGTVTQITTPVKLMSFTAKNDGNFIKLNWVTASEHNNSYFEVLRVLENKETQVIGTITGKGTSSDANNYSFIDHHPVMGINYYQLKQVDYNGDYKYSDIVPVEIKSNVKFNISPNPVEDTLIVSHPFFDTNAYIKVLSIDGKSLIKYAIPIGSTVTHLDVSSLIIGMYLVIYEGENKKSVLRFVKK